MKLKNLTTNFGETLKVGQTIYIVEFGRPNPMKLRLIEIKVDELRDRRVSSHKNPTYYHKEWNDIVVSGLYTILSVIAFGDEVDTHREFLLDKTRFGILTGPGYFQERGVRIFYTDKEKAIEAFKNKYRNNFINNGRKLIPMIFTGTGHKYAGHEFVGYKYYQYHLPK